ncbi:hypothetical protein JCM3766R1_001148 [Sporobolomyces carnicolor]
MLFPVLAPAISATSSHCSDASQSPTRPKRRISFPLLSNSDSTDSATSAAASPSSSPRSLATWFSSLKRRNSDEGAELEAKLVKSCLKLDRKEREKRDKAMKKMEKEQRVRARREQDARAYAAWLQEQKLYYSTNGAHKDDKRRDHDEEFFPHGVWTGAYLF